MSSKCPECGYESGGDYEYANFESTHRRESAFADSVYLQDDMLEYLSEYFSDVWALDGPGADDGGVLQELDWMGVDMMAKTGSGMPAMVAYRGRDVSDSGADFSIRYATTNGMESEFQKWEQAYNDDDAQLPRYCAFGHYRDISFGFTRVYLIDLHQTAQELYDGDLDYLGPYASDNEGCEAVYVPVEDLREHDCIVEEWHPIDDGPG